MRSWSRIDFASTGYPEESPDPLDVLIARANAYVANTTGRALDSTMPVALTELAQECVQMRVEQKALQQDQDYAETGADDQTSGFTAGPYTETRSPEGQRVTRQGELALPLVNQWPALNQLLWSLMTEDMRDFWRQELMGVIAPAWGGIEVDWQGYGTTFPDFPDYRG